jgi:hypothetical protein
LRETEKVSLPTDRVPLRGMRATSGERISLDLRVGVTGHRKLALTPALSTAIDQALDLILDQLRPAVRDRCTLVAVSALADGADRFVAKRVLARPRARLEVILPLPKADYVTDFDPQDSLPEFEHLLGAASWVASVPPEEAQEDPPERARQDAYAAAGRAVADRADVMVAVWDGHPAAGKGGTGDVVNYLREHGRPWVWLPADGGQAHAENLEKLTDAGWAAMADADLARFDEFNKITLHAEQRAAIIDEFQRNILSFSEVGLAADLTMLLGWLQDPFARAELLSRKFQSRYHRLSSMLFALAALAVCIVGTQLVFFPGVELVVVGEIVCLVVILGALEWGRRAHLQQRWISARYLAERLRNSFFLALVGADEQPPTGALVSEDIPAAPWVGTAFRMVWMQRPPIDADPVPVASLRGFLSHAWVDHQRRYFRDTSARDSKRYRFSTRAVVALFAASLVIAIVHVALRGPENWVKHTVSLLAISIPACAAALVGYTTQREYLRNSIRYDRMADNLDRANHVMLGAADHTQVREISATVDRMLREERGEWFSTVGLHDLELPV